MYTPRNIPFRLLIPYAWRYLLGSLVLATGVLLIEENYGLGAFGLPFAPMGMLGMAVAVLLAFRNNSSYERFSAARRAWGEITSACRFSAMQITTFVSTRLVEPGVDLAPLNVKQIHRELVLRLIAFAHAMRLKLRGQSDHEALVSFVPAEELALLRGARNVPNQLLQTQSVRLAELLEVQLFEDYRHMAMSATIERLAAQQVLCEGIKDTPLPRQFTYLATSFVWAFLVLIPFSLAGEFGTATIPLTVVAFWLFRGLDQVAALTEDPFENHINDVPMTAICRDIEICLREQLGEGDLPPAIEPKDGVLM